MANIGLVEHSVSISSHEAVGSQGSSGSSLKEHHPMVLDTCMLVEGASILSDELEGGSKAAPTTEDKATSGKLDINIGNVKEGGSKAVPTKRDKATSGKLDTNIGNVKEGGSKAVPITEDKVTSGKLAIDMYRVRGGWSKAVTSMEDKATSGELVIGFICKPTSDSLKATAEMVQSNGGGNIA
eukprot:3753666-Ditylum_brightwellii.AAC.1